MTAELKLRRTVLYMPGANQRALAKARELPCDGIIFDLEDAVAVDAKAQARAQVAAAVREGGDGYRELIVRVNGLDTPWGADDIPALAGLPVHGMLFPKVETVAQVDRIVAGVDAAGARELPLWFMIDTPLAILDARALATRTRTFRHFPISAYAGSARLPPGKPATTHQPVYRASARQSPRMPAGGAAFPCIRPRLWSARVQSRASSSPPWLW